MKNPITSMFPRRLRSRTNSSFMNPWRLMEEWESEIERMFGRGGRLLEESTFDFDFSPSCDFKETPTEYILKFDIPGVKKDQVKIEVEDNRLTVKGERKRETEQKDENKYFCESYYGSFMRSFSLPNRIVESKVDAHYEDGVLTIKVPKAETQHAKSVEIH